MPVWLQHLTWVNPVRHFVEIVKGVFLKDASAGRVLWSPVWPLMIISTSTLLAAAAMFRRRTA